MRVIKKDSFEDSQEAKLKESNTDTIRKCGQQFITLICLTHIIISLKQMFGSQEANKDESLNDFNVDATTVAFEDSISSINWAPAAPGARATMFAVGTWDGNVRIFNVEQGGQGAVQVVQKFQLKLAAPVMSVTWNAQGNGLFAGCADNFVRAVDLGAGKSVDVGKHTAPVKDVFYVASQNAVMTTSYDKSINFWQLGNPNPIYNVTLPHKLYAADFQTPLFAAGLSSEKILLFDINNIGHKVTLDSQLGKESQIQSVSLSADCETFGMGSVDGRANLSTIGKQVNGDLKLTNIMTFKSNKIDEGGKSVLYPVNAVGFNARSKNWFFTAGADGFLLLWDYQARNKIKQFGFGRVPITAARVSPTGEMLAYALGNDWHAGPDGIGQWKTKLAVHYVKDDELKFLK